VPKSNAIIWTHNSRTLYCYYILLLTINLQNCRWKIWRLQRHKSN